MQLLNSEFLGDSNLDLLQHQEYAQMCTCVQAGEIAQIKAINIIQGILEEILLDLLLAKRATYKIVQGKPLSWAQKAIFINEEDVFQKVYRLWENWDKSDLDGYFPDQAPVIRQSEKIRERTNGQLYQVLITLLDGRNTFRDIAIKTNRDVVQITQALRTFIQLRWIDLLDIPDYASSTDAIEAKTLSSEPKRDWALIACVDDSPLVCRSMEQIVKTGGYNFVAVLDSQRAISTLLSKKPDIIFLDLVMPYTNGYEICSQLRKVSKFSDTPIIILSGNDGVVDQVRARLMGATDFVSKPVDPAIILNIIHRYLEVSTPIYQ
ncbi:MAG: response regulator [Leptolyngbya sp. SIO1D8]|nr:response regulator [Leptolyngbya sp. SIO1D8]